MTRSSTRLRFAPLAAALLVVIGSVAALQVTGGTTSSGPAAAALQSCAPAGNRAGERAPLVPTSTLQAWLDYRAGERAPLAENAVACALP